MANAAMSAKSIRTILTQECLRIFRNTSVELGEDIRNKHLNNFMLKLKKSGHSVNFRKQILNSAFQAFQKMIEDDKSGTKPMFRARNWNSKERYERKLEKKRNWFNTGRTEIDYKSVLFVPPTPGGELIRELKQRELELNKNDKARIKFVEKSGVKMEDMLVKKDPFPAKKCEGKELNRCFVCQSAGPEEIKVSCRKNNLGYGLICDTCDQRSITKVYEGETARSAKIRGFEHLRGFANKNKNNVLFKHKESDHPSETMKMKMVITGTFQDALTRQCNEAVRIHRRSAHTLLNSKSEMNHPKVARITVEKKTNAAQQ